MNLLNMSVYVVKRILYASITLFLVCTITFFLMFLVPGGPFLAEKSPSQATLDALNEKYGLDQPIHIQYKNYILNMLKGDLGASIKQRGRDVSEIIAERFPVSAGIGIYAAITAIMIGIPLGAISALNRGNIFDNIIIFFATIGVSVPSFVIATGLLITFGVNLKILPTYGLSTPLHHIMPVIALSIYPCAYMARLMRSNMLDVLTQDYMRTAKAKGVSNMKCLFKHALKNSISPVLTYIGPILAYMLVGSFVVEKVFTIPGLGSEYISSIINRDYPVIMGISIFLAALIMTANVITDIIYVKLDPRIKFK